MSDPDHTETRMGPRKEIPDDPLFSRPLLQEHPQHLVSEEPRQRLRLLCPLDWDEGAIPPKQAPRDQKMHVGAACPHHIATPK